MFWVARCWCVSPDESENLRLRVSSLHVIVHVPRCNILITLGARAAAVDLAVVDDRTSFNVFLALTTAFVRGTHGNLSVKGGRSFEYTKQIMRFFKLK